MHTFFSDPKLFNNTCYFILNHGGKDEDCEDIFQEAFIIFDRNIRQGKYRGESSLSTYFMGIVRLLWLSTQRRKIPNFGLNELGNEKSFDNIEIEIIKEEEKKVLYDALGLLGEKCKDLLLLTGITTSNEEIAQIRGYSSNEMAKKEVYRCREKFRNFIKEHPYLDNFLKSIIKK